MTSSPDSASGPPTPISDDTPAVLVQIEAQLTAPGQMFALEEITAHGATMQAFANRPRALTQVLDNVRVSGDEHLAETYMVWLDGRRYTFGETLDAIDQVARGLRDRFGITKGDRVAIAAANCPEWVLAFWACQRLGAIAVGLNGWWKGPELRYAITHCEPKVLITDAKRLTRIADSEGEKLECAVIGIDSDADVAMRVDATFDELLQDHESSERQPGLEDPQLTEDDPALILYTSGTTGRPKGVVHTHRNMGSMLMTSFFHGARIMALNPPPPEIPPPPTCVLVTSPLFHVSGLHAAAIVTLAGGVKSVWSMGRFDPAKVLEIIEQEKVTSWGYTATMLRRVVMHPDAQRRDLSSMKIMGGGGSPIPKELQEFALTRFPQVTRTMGVGYGLTEGSAFTALNAGPELRAHPDSSGRPFPTVQIEIRDDNGEPQPEGTIGNIHIRGPLVMAGYWNDDEATAEVIDDDRWLKTGDVGYLEDGRIYLAARTGDLILRGGENVYPAEIEQRLAVHEEIRECAVVGVPHDDLGQAVHAVVVLEKGATAPSEQTLREWVSSHLADFKVPATWEIRPASEPLPRNATGKVLKHVLTGGASAFVQE